MLFTFLLGSVLRWGGDLQGGEPYVYQDPANPEKLIGFEVELADAIAKEMGRNAQFVQTDWSTMLQGLDRDTYDIAMNGLEDAPDRRAAFAVTQPYFSFDLVLTTKAGAGAVKTVGVLENSLAQSVAQQKGWEAKIYQGVEEPYLDVAAGRIDGVLMDHIIERAYGHRDGLAVRDRSVAKGTYIIACAKKNSALCGEVDAALARVKASGKWRAVLEKWRLWADDPDAPVAEKHFTAQHFWLFVRASLVTLYVSLLAMALACSIGLVFATARAFGPAPVRIPASVAVEVLRGTPILLQLFVVYFGLAPYLLLSPTVAAVLTLGLNYGAYEAEIYRGGLNAVPERQWDAGLALGLTRRQTFRHIILPQAVRVALPGMANDFVALLKDSALVSVITVVELTKQMQITAVDVRSWLLPGAVCAAIYLAMSLPASRLGRYLEGRLHA